MSDTVEGQDAAFSNDTMLQNVADRMWCFICHSRIDPEEMYYLMSRGLRKEEAERLVIRGFLGSVLTAIPVKEVQQELVAVIEGKLLA